MTRSFIHLAHGDFAASLAAHRVGWFLALLVALQIPYRLWAMRSVDGAPLGTLIPWVVAWSSIALLLASWVVKISLRLT